MHSLVSALNRIPLLRPIDGQVKQSLSRRFLLQ